jgi:hypothetical protein
VVAEQSSEAAFWYEQLAARERLLARANLDAKAALFEIEEADARATIKGLEVSKTPTPTTIPFPRPPSHSPDHHPILPTTIPFPQCFFGAPTMKLLWGLK